MCSTTFETFLICSHYKCLFSGLQKQSDLGLCCLSGTFWQATSD